MGVKASPSLVLAHAGTHPLPCPRACGDPSSPLSSRMRGPIPLPPPTCHPAPPPPLLPRRACPSENGGGNPSLILPRPHVIPSAAESRNLVALPLIVLADAGTHPSLRCSRGEPAPVKTGAGTQHSFSPDHMSFRAQRSRGILLPFPSLSSRMRGPIPPSVVPAESLPP